MIRNPLKKLLRAATVGALAAGVSLAIAPAAWANNWPGTTPSSGGPESASADTPFQFNGQSAQAQSCPTATSLSGGDVLDSYVVDNSVVPTTSLAQLTFPASSGNAPVFGSYTGVPLFDTGGTGYTNNATLAPNPGTTAGTWQALPAFSWSIFAQGADYGPGADLHDGVFNIGIACVTPSGTIDNGAFWGLQVTFTSAGNAVPFNWSTAPGPTTPEVPYAVILPAVGAGLLLGGGALVRRRQRKSLVASAS